jgi:hypothetical protein
VQAVGNPRQRSELIEKDSHLSIRRQCRLLHIHRSMIYYDLSEETVENLELMKKLDHLYLEDPSAGSRRMSSYLKRQTGAAANRKRFIHVSGRPSLAVLPVYIHIDLKDCIYRIRIRSGAPTSRLSRCARATCICLL